MIRTKSIYAPKEADDGRRILITRYYPRGVKRVHFDDWLRDLAPSARLLRLYQNGHISPREFVVRYKIEIDDDASRQIMRDIKRDSTTCNVTLLCYEPEGEFCHRHILKDMINSRTL